MMKKIKTAPAFSLVELILYVGIASLIIGSMMLFIIQMIEVRGDAEFDREVNENARFALDYVTQQIHDAQGLNTGTFGAHPSSFTLDVDGSGTLVIDTDTKTVGSSTIRFLQSDGTQLTSDKVNVTNFVVHELTRDTEPENLQIELTLESLDGLTSSSFRTAISLRQ
jgi:Tfp pilus assembly protein PilW